jgi:excisionase family DNA binding protein
MISFNPSDSPLPSLDGILLDKCITVKAAAEVTGYSAQYLRRLLRAGKLDGTKIGQVWLIRLASLETYARNGHLVGDRRHGPRKIVADAGEGKTI